MNRLIYNGEPLGLTLPALTGDAELSYLIDVIRDTVSSGRTTWLPLPTKEGGTRMLLIAPGIPIAFDLHKSFRYDPGAAQRILSQVQQSGDGDREATILTFPSPPA